jgi:hypothetical protein
MLCMHPALEFCPGVRGHSRVAALLEAPGDYTQNAVLLGKFQCQAPVKFRRQGRDFGG